MIVATRTAINTSIIPFCCLAKHFHYCFFFNTIYSPLTKRCKVQKKFQCIQKSTQHQTSPHKFENGNTLKKENPYVIPILIASFPFELQIKASNFAHPMQKKKKKKRSLFQSSINYPFNLMPYPSGN